MQENNEKNIANLENKKGTLMENELNFVKKEYQREMGELQE